MACSKHRSYRHLAKSIWKVCTITENKIHECKIGAFTVKSFCLKLFTMRYVCIFKSYLLPGHEGNTSEVMDQFHKAPNMS